MVPQRPQLVGRAVDDEVYGGYLRASTGTPVSRVRFVADLAAALNDAVSDVDRAAAFGRAGRTRAVESFSWASIGDRTLEVYREVLGT